MKYQEKVNTRSDVLYLYDRVKQAPTISHYRGYTDTKSYGWDEDAGDCVKVDGEHWFDNPCYDPNFFALDDEEKTMDEKATPKHPSFSCRRGMLCPACDKALWTSVEIKSWQLS